MHRVVVVDITRCRMQIEFGVAMGPFGSSENISDFQSRSHSSMRFMAQRIHCDFKCECISWPLATLREWWPYQLCVHFIRMYYSIIICIPHFGAEQE